MDPDYYSVRLAGASDGSQVDFQVESLVGYYTQVMASPVPGFRNSDYYVFNGQSSGWSDTQTITIPNNLNPTNRTIQPTASPTQTPAAPLQPRAQSKVLFGLSWDEVAIIALSFVVVVLVAATLFYRRISQGQVKQPQPLSN